MEERPNGAREHEVVLPGLADLSGLVWAADGRGWFVSVDTTVGNRLLYVWPDGWAVPSPCTPHGFLEPHHRYQCLDDRAALIGGDQK